MKLFNAHFLVDQITDGASLLRVLEVTREFVWLFYGYFNPDEGKNKLERDLTKDDFEGINAEIQTLKS